MDKINKYYEDEKKRIEANYASGVSSLDKSKQASSEMAAVTRERLMKYLPQQLKSQGIHTQGVSEDATIKAFNNYQNTMAGISQNYDTSLAALDKSKNDSMSALESDVLSRKEREQARIDEDKNRHLNTYTTIMTGAKDGTYDVDDVNGLISAYGKFTEDETKALVDAAVGSRVESYKENAETDNVVTPEDAEGLKEYLESNKETIGEDAYQKYIDAMSGVTVASPKITDEEYAKIISDYNVRPNGSVFDTKTSSAEDILATLNVYKGEEQTDHVARILAESKTWGADKNGTIKTFNYGNQAGDSKGNYFVFYNGKWYQTNYKQGDFKDNWFSETWANLF